MSSGLFGREKAKVGPWKAPAFTGLIVPWCIRIVLKTRRNLQLFHLENIFALFQGLLAQRLEKKVSLLA